jgi:hypothetical protein
MADARISVSVREGTIEIEGSESFVIGQMARFESLIQKALEQAGKRPAAGPSKDQKESPSEGSKDSSVAEYANLYAVADGKVQITRDLPGTTKAEKSVNAALLLTHANTLLGTDTTSYDAIRNMCSTHGCLDGTNFAKTIRAEKELFIVSGPPKGRVIKLSVPGLKKADVLAARLNAE